MTSEQTGFDEFQVLLEQSLRPNVHEGGVVRGRVVHIGKDYVTVDIGYKSEGHIPLREFLSPMDGVSVREGDEVDVLFERVEDDTGMIVLSKEKADLSRAWTGISRAYDENLPLEGTVLAKVKGGMVVDIGVQAFLPGSQIDLRPVKNLDDYLGKKFHFKIIKFNRHRGNIVLSRRMLLEEERETLKSKTLESLREGQILEGVVKNITDYGVFVDLGGIDGLLHVTDIAWSHVDNPASHFTIGQEIRVKVLKYDPKSEKVSLGYKQVMGDPWMTVHERYTSGDRVRGRVVSLTDYGAFVELEDGVEGLIHVSEMSWTKRVKHPSQILSVNDQVAAVILDMDLENRRISLGLKQTQPDPWRDLVAKYPSGTLIRGKIKNLTDFGAFVEVEEGIDGLLHVSDISWDRNASRPSEIFQKGQEVDVVILEVDADNHRISLGYKQLTSDPWKNVQQKYTVGSVAEGTIAEAYHDGYSVDFGGDVSGFLPVDEIPISNESDGRPAFTIGQKVTTQIIQVDNRDRRLSLSIKSYEKTMEKKAVRDYMERQEKQSGSSLGEILKSKGKSDLVQSVTK